MNRHLNAFVPYHLAGTHEDQLTRAAMIVLRAVPLARDALLAQLGCQRSGELPEAEFDMQTGDVVTPTDDVDDEVQLAELVSVFLSPDVDLDLTGVSLSEREAEQRLDGVMRFGDQLVIVIESKVVGQAPSNQASELRLRGARVERGRVESLGWHDLLRSWWRLLERGLLAPAERVLIEDLVAFTEEYFPHLLPFSTLIEAGDHPLRQQRRLMAYRGAQTDAQRLYPTCRLPVTEYVRRWSEEDLDRIGGYKHDTVRTELWPWLKGRGYASDEDDAHLDEFLEGLGRRDAHLRPRTEITHRWTWADAEVLDEPNRLAGEIRSAVTELLAMLDEPSLTDRGNDQAATEP